MTEQASRFFALLNQHDPSAYEELEEALAASRISPDAADVNGVTLLLCALRRMQYEIAELLLDEGANPFVISKFGQTAAGLIVRTGNAALKKSLLEWGDAYPSYDAKGEAWPVLQGLCRSAALGECMVLAQGTAAEERDAWGHTALMLAVMHGQDQAASALLKAGADPRAPQTLVGFPMIRFLNAVKPLQHPVLTKCMEDAYAGIVQSEIGDPSDGDPISPENLASISSMHHLVRRGDVSRIRRLLDLGVLPSLRNSHGCCVLQIAEQTRETEAEALIRSWNTAHQSCACGCPNEHAQEKSLAGPGMKHAAKTKGNCSYPVRKLKELNAQKLIEEGDVAGLQILLGRGISPDSLMSNGSSMLVHACRTNLESFLFLLLTGASPYFCDKNGDSAAAAANGSQLATLYIQRFSTRSKRVQGAASSELVAAVLAEDTIKAACLAASNPQWLAATTEAGVSLLGIAAQRGNLMLCKILLDLGADPWQKCLGAWIPLEFTSHDDVRAFLKSRMDIMKGWVYYNRAQPMKTTWYESAKNAIEEDLYGKKDDQQAVHHRLRTVVVPSYPAEAAAANTLDKAQDKEASPLSEENSAEKSFEADDEDLSFIDEAASALGKNDSDHSIAESRLPAVGRLDDDDFGIFDADPAGEVDSLEVPGARSDKFPELRLPPSAASLSESLRGLGYSLGDAVADIIDNSIAAGSRQVWVDYSLESPADSWLSIRDSGCGMSADELRTAMRLGSKSPKMQRQSQDLGRFGLGLKTASFSQCRRLTVCSKKDGVVCAYAWDLDALAEADDWVVELVDMPLSDVRFQALEHQDSGTVVLWEKVDRAFGSCEVTPEEFVRVGFEALDRLKKHLSLTFHQYLAQDEELGPDLEIRFGPRLGRIEPWDPFLSASFASPRRYQEEFWPSDASEPQVSIKPYVVPDPSSSGENITLYGEEDLLDMQGFFIYRGKRLICRAGWLNLGIPKTPLHALARLKLTFDNRHDLDWQLDIRKSTVRIPRKKGWNRLRQLLCLRADDAARKSEEVLGAALEKSDACRANAAEPASMWRKERGAAAQIDFSTKLGAAYRDALASANNPEVVQGILELLAYSHPAQAARAQYSEVSPLARAAIVELAYVLAKGDAENVPAALSELAANAPFSYWPSIMNEFKEEES